MKNKRVIQMMKDVGAFNPSIYLEVKMYGAMRRGRKKVRKFNKRSIRNFTRNITQTLESLCRLGILVSLEQKPDGDIVAYLPSILKSIDVDGKLVYEE